MLSHLKNKNPWINEILDVAMKFQFNPLKPICSTRHPHDPTLKQIEYVNDRNFVQLKRLQFLTVSRFLA
jgi:hypothetical protein